MARDSAPLWGCGWVEDTFNLLGHAQEIVLQRASVVIGLEPERIRAHAHQELTGGSSLDAQLDID